MVLGNVNHQQIDALSDLMGAKPLPAKLESLGATVVDGKPHAIFAEAAAA